MPNNPEIFSPAAILDPVKLQLDRIEKKLDQLLTVGRPVEFWGDPGAFDRSRSPVELTTHQTSL